MASLYHHKSAAFRGTTLYPLNRLREVYPDLYDRERAKYHGREDLMAFRIPFLDVCWNDVLHCAPIHPYHVFAALRDAGARPDPDRRWFAIPLARLAHRRAVYYRFATGEPSRPSAADFAAFTPATYRELAALPPRTAAYYKQRVRLGERPLLFRGVPHVLVEGPLDIAAVPVVTWSVPPD